jgi:acyl-[acyl-carrier-protein]-phospholipid O-acyltransferase/long-chain-fatty-acid--[acyl-carrier-protein] ligase
VFQAPELHDVSTTKARWMLTAWLRDRLLEQQFLVEMEFGPKDVLAAISETHRWC